MNNQLLHSASVLCTTLILWASPSIAQNYDITDLGAFPGGEDAWAFGINDNGQIAATAHYNAASRFFHAALWEDNTFTDLGQLGPKDNTFHSFATAINAQGHIVGSSLNTNTFGAATRSAFRHDGNEMIPLTPLDNGIISIAFDIHDNGTIVGQSHNGENINNRAVMHAVLWSNESVTDLGTLGGQESRAHAINQSNRIVGASLINEGPLHAFVWFNGEMTDIGTLGGQASEALDINETDQIIGWAHNTTGAQRAFLYEKNVMIDLGALPEAQASQAFGLNNQAQIVGTSWIPGQGPHAVLWDKGIALDLNDFLEENSPWTLQYARQINNFGQIVGYGRLDGATKAFLLTPQGCLPDLTNDGQLDIADIAAFITALNAQDPIADFTSDGSWNFFDVSAFLQAFAAGCP